MQYIKSLKCRAADSLCLHNNHTARKMGKLTSQELNWIGFSGQRARSGGMICSCLLVGQQYNSGVPLIALAKRCTGDGERGRLEKGKMGRSNEPMNVVIFRQGRATRVPACVIKINNNNHTCKTIRQISHSRSHGGCSGLL